MNILRFTAALCSCISLLCLLVALGSDYWMVILKTYVGLWNACEDKTCNPLDVKQVPGFLYAVRTFMCLGMIAGAVSLGGLCAIKYSLGNISMSRITYIASFTAGLCVMIAMSIVTGQSRTENYGWSFGVGWASFCFYILTVWLTYKLYKSTEETT